MKFYPSGNLEQGAIAVITNISYLELDLQWAGFWGSALIVADRRYAATLNPGAELKFEDKKNGRILAFLNRGEQVTGRLNNGASSSFDTRKCNFVFSHHTQDVGTYITFNGDDYLDSIRAKFSLTQEKVQCLTNVNKVSLSLIGTTYFSDSGMLSKFTLAEHATLLGPNNRSVEIAAGRTVTLDDEGYVAKVE